VLAKLDYRFPETESVKLHQLLDPETKDLLSRQEASRVLEDAINVAYARGLISGAAPQLHVSVPSCSETATTSDEDDAATRRKGMRMEMVNELRCQTPGRSNNSAVGIF